MQYIYWFIATLALIASAVLSAGLMINALSPVWFVVLVITLLVMYTAAGFADKE